MTENKIPREGELIRSLIELLWYRPAGIPAKDIFALIPKITPLTEFEAGFSSNNNLPRYETILRMATIPFVKAGWLVKSNKGRWYLTEEGRQACKDYTNAQDLYQESLRLFEEEQQSIPEMMINVESSEEAAWDQIEKYLQGRKPFELKSMLAHLLRASGYHVAWMAPSGENSKQVDIVAWMDPIGAKQPRILVQVIHKGQAMTAEGVKSFFSLLRQNDFGLIFSSGGLTNEAREEMKSASQNMSLMDLESCFDLWVTHYNKLDLEAQKLLPLKSIYFLSL
jgi:restriction system protein